MPCFISRFDFDDSDALVVAETMVEAASKIESPMYTAKMMDNQSARVDDDPPLSCRYAPQVCITCSPIVIKKCVLHPLLSR